MVIGEVLYNNASRQASPSYSGSVTSGFEPQNAFDWRDFSLFRPNTGTTQIDITLTSNIVLNRAAIWCAPAPGSSVTSIKLQYESSPGVFTDVSTWGSPSASILWSSFADINAVSGRKVRWLFTGVTGYFDIRQLVCGPVLQFEIGQWVGISPASLQFGVIVENVIAVNGSILARNVKRVEKKGEIKLNYLTESWVRNSWNSFAIHATRYPFLWLWNPAKSQDAAFAAAESIEGPVNEMPTPRMSVNMPIRFLT